MRFLNQAANSSSASAAWIPVVCSPVSSTTRDKSLIPFRHSHFIISGQICTIRPHPNFRVFMAMNSISGEVSQPMRNRGLEISILSSAFSRADAVQVALAVGVSMHDTTKLLSNECDIRRANFIAETARALGGSGCSMQETLELIQELHPQPTHQPHDSTNTLHSVVIDPISHLQQPSLHTWLNCPHQSKFLRICCSVASIAEHIKRVSESNSPLQSMQSPPSLLAAACALALYGSSQNYDDIGRVLSTLPPNAFLELVGAGIAHLREQNFSSSEDVVSFDVLLGFLGICSTSSCSNHAIAKTCNFAILRIWFSLVLSIDSIFMLNQGSRFTHILCPISF